MKFSVDRELIFSALTKARSIIEARNTIPILSNVRLTAKDGKLAVRATDLDIQMDSVMTADVEAEGSITIPCATVYDIVKTIAKRAVISCELNPEKTQVTVKSGRARMNINALPSADYPDLDAQGFSHTFKMAKGDIIEMLQGTSFAISSEETRYYLCGIYFHTRAEEIRACATDGHRLALICKTLPEGADGCPGIIIPTKTVSAILSMANVDTIEISISSQKTRWDFGDTVLLSKVIEGTFPDYERVIPRGNNRRLKIDREALIAGVNRCSAIGIERGHAIRFDLDETTGLKLSTKSSEKGDATEEIEAEFESDGPLAIGVNSRYLVSVAEKLTSDHIIMKFGDSGSPILVMEKEGSADTAVIMPMRV